MSDFVIKKAQIEDIILLIGLWGGTGGGKTESSLRLARGLAGPNGRVCIVDTEHKRSTYFVKRIPGGFDHIDFSEPYTPERYIEALTTAERGADVVVLDSATHLWEGPDGILDLHEKVLDKMTKHSEDWRERERLNWPAWREPKMRYKAVRNKILGFKVPLIVCFRGEEKTRLVKGADGKNTVLTDTHTSPVFEKRLIFEMHIAVECFQQDGKGGYIRFPWPHAKVSNDDLLRILPESGKGQLSVETGAALARWAAGSAPPPAKPPPDERAALKQKLWQMTENIHLGRLETLKTWLVDEKILVPDKPLADCSVAELKAVIEKAAKAEAKL